MNTDEITFMTAACQASDDQEGGSLFVGEIAPILAALSEKGMTEKQVWRCQLSLKRTGYIRLHATYNVDDVDPEWSTAAPELTITPQGLRWWLLRKHGQSYSKMVADIKRTRDECIRNKVMSVAEWADRVKLPLPLVQKVIHAENLK